MIYEDKLGHSGEKILSSHITIQKITTDVVLHSFEHN